MVVAATSCLWSWCEAPVSHLNARSSLRFWVKERDGRGPRQQGGPGGRGGEGDAGGRGRVGGDGGERVVVLAPLLRRRHTGADTGGSQGWVVGVFVGEGRGEGERRPDSLLVRSHTVPLSLQEDLILSGVAVEAWPVLQVICEGEVAVGCVEQETGQQAGWGGTGGNHSDHSTDSDSSPARGTASLHVWK